MKLLGLVDTSKAEDKRENSGVMAALGLAWQLGYIIALPIVILALGGRFLDVRSGTSPLFLLVGMSLAVVVTTVWMYRKSKTMLAEIESKTKN